ncbi:unnamed protein product, partial [Didymodactylos carnosus]
MAASNGFCTGAYSLQLPYLGSIQLGKSPPNLYALQKPLRELYIPYRRRHQVPLEERRIIISTTDIIMFEPDAALKGKKLIYSDINSIVDVQALGLYMNKQALVEEKKFSMAFLPIGCENESRFQSLYSTIDKTQNQLLNLNWHPPICLLIMRKIGTTLGISSLDCHTFLMLKESRAFEFCDMIRKLLSKRSPSPLLKTTSTLLKLEHLNKNNNNDNNDQQTRIKTKYLNRHRPVSAMEHSQVEINTNSKNRRSVSIAYSNDIRSSLPCEEQQKKSSGSDDVTQKALNNNLTNTESHSSCSLLSSSSPLRTLNIKQRSSRNEEEKEYDEQDQLHNNNKERHFIKASNSLTNDDDQDLESIEVVNELLSIYAENLKNTLKDEHYQQQQQQHIQRRSSFISLDQQKLDQTNLQSSLNTMKKRIQQQQHQPRTDSSSRPRSANRLFGLGKKRVRSPHLLPTILSATNTPTTIRSSSTYIEKSPPPLPPPISSLKSNGIENSGHLLRPQLVLNRYGDIGNYVPKLLRNENGHLSQQHQQQQKSSTWFKTLKSDSNDNIFFRANNGHIINGFLNIDFANNSNNNLYCSSPCLNQRDYNTDRITPHHNGYHNGGNNLKQQRAQTDFITPQQQQSNGVAATRIKQNDNSQFSPYKKDLSNPKHSQLPMLSNNSVDYEYDDGYPQYQHRIPRAVLDTNTNLQIKLMKNDNNNAYVINGQAMSSFVHGTIGPIRNSFSDYITDPQQQQHDSNPKQVIGGIKVFPGAPNRLHLRHVDINRTSEPTSSSFT